MVWGGWFFLLFWKKYAEVGWLLGEVGDGLSIIPLVVPIPNRAGRCEMQSSITWIYMGKNLKKIVVQFFFSIRSASFSFFSLFWSTTHVKEAKNENPHLLRYFIATCFIRFLSSGRLSWYSSLLKSVDK